ncbi:alpha/beta fold hydrolase [Enterococcus ureasiticus]|uniref:Serine aminopeptidase S33 domain-containing protein n=1 Tax=Enterococcus ureasiticus TaxID=903984 RepID=A0A1E5GCF0_9ENTE|nr:alpha/beta hydrolase [Enterococcus ureasiticus]OEG10349.1 hypothetical protein BCR21_13450 [Enterococcus ureasiticus]
MGKKKVLNEFWRIEDSPSQYNLDGFRFHTETENPKGTRLLIQGLGCESKVIWEDVLTEFEKLESQRDLIAFDVRGIGKSEGKSESFDQIIEDTIQVLRKEAPPIQLVGHSLGGLVALQVAKKIPELIDSVILVCSNPRYNKKSKSGFIWRAEQIRRLQSICCIFDKVIPRSFATDFINTHPTVISNFTNMLNRQSPTNYSNLCLIASEADALTAFDSITVPLLMIVGSKDPSITLERSSQFATRRKCTVESIDGAGHNIPLENPRELTNIIQKFDYTMVQKKKK